MSLPEQMYRVEVKVGTGTAMSYGERGGGSFTNLEHAITRYKRNIAKGRKARVMYTECDWQEVFVNEGAE